MTSLTLFTPAGVVQKAAPLRRAVKRLQGLGFDVRVDEGALARHERFGGTDDDRLAALHRVADARPSVALATRGGYGLTRLLDRLDWAKLVKSVEHGTRWVGYSDMTALQLGLLAHGKAPSWAGPMACGDFGGDELDEVTPDCFVEAMTGALEAVGFRTEAGFDGVDVTGTLWGGNLCVLMSLLGTPHWPKVKGGILFLEDVTNTRTASSATCCSCTRRACWTSRRRSCWVRSPSSASRRWTAATRSSAWSSTCGR